MKCYTSVLKIQPKGRALDTIAKLALKKTRNLILLNPALLKILKLNFLWIR